MSDAELSRGLIDALLSDVPPSDRRGDWDDVLGRVHLARRRPLFLLAAAAAVLAALTFGTPLGSAIRDGLAGFSAWLQGTPGQAVTPDEQRAFDEENARSYIAFPGSPQLRRLLRTEVGGATYELLGFRSGNSLCLRVTAAGTADGATTECAPIGDLENDAAPARVLIADWGVGQSQKTATIGFDTFRAPRAQVTAGIAADDVSALQLVDEAGSHVVDVSANAFLYVAPEPDVGQRVRHIRAVLAGGETEPVPFSVAPFGFPGGYGSTGEPGGPTSVERTLNGGTIGWLDRREERGVPLDTGPDLPRFFADAEFGRVLTPDPESGKRIAVAITGSGVCYAEIERSGTGGGCMGRPGHLFEHAPFTGGSGVNGAGAQYATFAGVASDDVARLEIFTATGNRIDVPLRDNAYLAEVALASMPAKLVAYDRDGRVIGIEQPPHGRGPQTPTGPAILRLSADSAAGSLELLVLRTKEGGQCSFMRGSALSGGEMGGCSGAEWQGPALALAGAPSDPAAFLDGRVREDVARIDLQYADGDVQTIEPERYGYVLVALPSRHWSAAARLEGLVGYDAKGRVVGRVRLPVLQSGSAP